MVPLDDDGLPDLGALGLSAEALAARRPFLQRRARLTAAVRDFFAARSYTEVETPYAVPAPGEEVHLRPFATVREHPRHMVQ